MFKMLPLFIGLRYLQAKRRHQFISFISGFAFMGMTLGTLALIVVLSVMNGFDREIRQRILSAIPHIFVEPVPTLVDWQALSSRLSEQPRVLATAPYIAAYAMLSSPNAMHSVELQGLLPEREQAVSVIHQSMTQGSMDALKPGEFGIVIGQLLATMLRVTVGDKMVMTLPDITITPAGLYPRVRRFTVVGIFEVGAQVDQSLAIIHLADAQKLLRYGQNVQGLRLKTDNMHQAQRVRYQLQEVLGEGFDVMDWSETQGSLFDAIQMEKRMVTLLLLIIIAIAALNIVTGLILMVADKRGDIAVLRTLGMTTGDIMCIFISQGSATGIAGIVVGAILGSVLGLYIGDVISWFEHNLGGHIFDPSVYFISQIPSQLQWRDVLLVGVCGIIMSLLATLYPARRAAQIEPAEVLRYES